MKNLLFISDINCNELTSNAVCISNIAGCSKNNTFVLLFGTDNALNDSVHGNLYTYYNKKVKTTLFSKFFKCAVNKSRINKMLSVLPEFIKKNNIDTVVCTYQPVENIYIGLRIKKMFPKIKVVGYFLDNPIKKNKNRLKEMVFNKQIVRLLKNFVKNTDHAYVLKYFKNSFTGINQNKITYTCTPSLVSINAKSDCKTKGNKMTIAYFGSFNNIHRNPRLFFDFFDKYFNDEGVFLDLYTSSDVQNYISNKGNNIRVKKPIYDRKKYLSCLNSADILLNFGNDNIDSVPGKIFEYISTGKKIINIKFLDNDVSDEIFEKYPNSITLNTKHLGQSEFIQLKSFINNNDVENNIDIQSIFHEFLPNETAKLFDEF